MEVVTLDVDFRKLMVRDLSAQRVLGCIQFRMNPQAGAGFGFSDEVNDHLVAHKRLAAPVLGDERKQPMLDLVPLAGSRRKVADGDRQGDLVGEALQFGFPQPKAIVDPMSRTVFPRI